MHPRSKSAVSASFRLNAALLVSLAAAGGASAATLSVGPGKTYAAPCAAFARAQSGDIVQIDGGKTYSGDVCAIGASNLTIRGVNGRPKIDAAGKNAQGKGTWVIQGNNTTVDNVEMAGASVPDGNGAALRVEGANFTLRSSFLHDNENGILTGANENSHIVIENTEFGANGRGDGYTHNVYIGHVGSLTFRYNYSHDANAGHNLKSRASVNTINYNRFSSSTGKPSYEIDLPNAGTSYVIGNVIHQPANHNNPGLLSYGNEGASNPGQDLYVVNNTFLNDDSVRGTFVVVGGSVTTPVLLQNNIFGGTGAATNQANAIDRTNFRSLVPGFVNRLLFDLHPTANVLVINAGSVPGVSATGVSLAPVAQYKHTAAGETRLAASARDIGAYAELTAGSTPAPTPTPTPTPATWTQCANENATCSFNGSREVRYGAGNAWVVKVFTNSVQCTNAVFGDPALNTVKTCSYAGAASTAPTPTPPAPVTWTVCAPENGTCSFSGARDVRYGVPGAYATKAFTNRAACTNAVFGDPKPNVVKSCSYSSQAR
ncbi:hypothetical protein AB2N08_13055 [Massilia aurea]|uniref:hypothetical protein n=1 Tax=Massilia aurea TaxID=373040 RepID=UPI003462CD4F